LLVAGIICWLADVLGDCTGNGLKIEVTLTMPMDLTWWMTLLQEKQGFIPKYRSIRVNIRIGLSQRFKRSSIFSNSVPVNPSVAMVLGASYDCHFNQEYC
jgi:hypothetical protein